MSGFLLRLGCGAFLAGMLGLFIWFMNWLLGASAIGTAAMLFGMLVTNWANDLAKAIEEEA